MQPFSTPQISLDSVPSVVNLQGSAITVYGQFPRTKAADYTATIEGIPCTVQSVTQRELVFLPHPKMLGSGFLNVALNDDPDRPAHLLQRLYIVKAGSSVDTSKVGPIRFDDPLLKVSNPSAAYYLRDLPLKLTGVEASIDEIMVKVGPLTFSNASTPNCLLKTDTGIVVAARSLEIADGTYPVTVEIPTKERIASGSTVTISPLPITGPKEQVYPGDTLTFDGYYSEVYVMVNGIRYSEGDPAHGIWRDGSSERMRVGPITSLAEGMTTINFVSDKTGRVVATSKVNSSQQRTEDLQWTPQQEYAGRTIEITYPSVSSNFVLQSCTIGNAWTGVLRSSTTQATVLLGPNVKQEGVVILTFRDTLDKSQIVINSRDQFVPLLRGVPSVPTRLLRIDLAIPGIWDRKAGGPATTVPGIENFTVDLVNSCAGDWCDTNMTRTYIPYWSVNDKRIDSYSETDSAYGSITFHESAGSAQLLRAFHFHREVLTGHNTTYNRVGSLFFELEDLGMPVVNGDKTQTITLSGEGAYQAIRTLQYSYFNSTRDGGSEGTSWLKLVRLEPTLASQCSITLTFTQ